MHRVHSPLSHSSGFHSIGPVEPVDRSLALDAVRGTALFGVLMVNLLTSFRVSLFEEMFALHTDAGAANQVVDIVIAWLFEFKAFTLFSVLFGLGVGVQIERAEQRNVRLSTFLVRRFAA